MTLGNAAAARVRFIVWCKECMRQVEPDPGEQARLCGGDLVLDKATNRALQQIAAQI